MEKSDSSTTLYTCGITIHFQGKEELCNSDIFSIPNIFPH